MMDGIERSLALLEKARGFEVKVTGYGYGVNYKDDPDDHPLIAVYDEDLVWRYYVGGLYNCGCDDVQIDLEKLDRLRAFCESLEGDAE